MIFNGLRREESMATGKALDGKPYAGNPHVRFDEGEAALSATPRRGSLLYKRLVLVIGATVCVAASAFDNTVQNDFWNTTAYVNPNPSVVGATLAEAFDAFVCDHADDPLATTFDNWCFELFGPFNMMQPFTSLSRGSAFNFR